MELDVASVVFVLFDMPPTSYKEYMLDKCQSIMYKVEVGILGMEYHFVGILP